MKELSMFNPVTPLADSMGLPWTLELQKLLDTWLILNTGKTVGTGRIENPQVSYGADIITRIAFAMESEANRKTLKKVVLDGINSVLAQACAKAEVDSDQVYATVLVGNTVMHHLCLGIQSKFTGVSPYVPALKSPLNISTAELGIKTNLHGIATFLPIIAGFVGADALADVIATKFYELEKTTMLVDIGTNTEVFVGNSEGYGHLFMRFWSRIRGCQNQARDESREGSH